MANKTFCPIMTIGFEAPKEGARDNRICMKDCAWYNVSEEKCAINIIAEHLEMIESLADDALAYYGGAYEELEEEDPAEDYIRGGSYRYGLGG